MTHSQRNNYSRTGSPMTALFLLWELVLYLVFMISDWKKFDLGLSTDYVKYGAIISCFLAAFYYYLKNHHSVQMLLASLLILPADFFLLFIPQYRDLGIVIFIGVQFCYLVRLVSWISSEEGNSSASVTLLHVGVLTGLIYCLLVLVLALLRVTLSCTELFALLYGLMFVMNLIFGFFHMIHKPGKTSILMFAGLLLFFCCDVHVALNALMPQLPDHSFLLNYALKMAFLGMWMFYLPGQVLLVCSMDGN